MNKSNFGQSAYRLRRLLRTVGSLSVFLAIGTSCLSHVLDPEPREVLAVKRLADAIRAVDWRTTAEGAAKEAIERAIHPFDWSLTYFGMAHTTKEMPRLVVAHLNSALCATPSTWVAALGLPDELQYLTVHLITRIQTPASIARALRGEEIVAGPLGSMNYPTPGQPDFSFWVIGKNECFNSLTVEANFK